jgi:transcriptional regulator with XRE-family HTH domain
MKLKINEPVYVRVLWDGGHHIKAWRKHLDLSVHHLSEKISGLPGEPSLSASMISQLEQGKAGYTQKTLELLASALNLQPWQLLAGRPGETKGFWRAALDHCESKEVWDQIDESDKILLEKIIATYCEAAVGAVLKSAPDILRKELPVAGKGEPSQN